MKLRYILVSAALILGVLCYYYVPSILIPIRPLPIVLGNINGDTSEQSGSLNENDWKGSAIGSGRYVVAEIEINAAARCGVAPESHRILVKGGPAPWDEKQISLPPIHLVGTFGEPGRSEIIVRLISDKEINYVSRDHGATWTRAGWDQIGTQYKFRASPTGWTDCTISRTDSKIVYDCAKGPHTADFGLSFDRGNTWRIVHPKLDGGRHLGKCLIFDTGLRDPARVYAEISAPKVYGLGVSTDYGSNFKILPYRQFESRANPAVIFRISERPGDRGVFLSHDPRSMGLRLNSMRSFFQGLFQDLSFPSVIRTWQMKAPDTELSYYDRIQQIETDPLDERVFYAFHQFRGILRTVDGGKTASLLPLALDKYLEIESFAVDPSDGKYLYAILNSRALYRSTDYGCSWKQLQFP